MVAPLSARCQTGLPWSGIHSTYILTEALALARHSTARAVSPPPCELQKQAFPPVCSFLSRGVYLQLHGITYCATCQEIREAFADNFVPVHPTPPTSTISTLTHCTSESPSANTVEAAPTRQNSAMKGLRPNDALQRGWAHVRGEMVSRAGRRWLPLAVAAQCHLSTLG